VASVDCFAPGLFQGRVVAVTGGGTGIGLAIADAFARLGARLTLASRKPENVEAAAARLQAAGGEALAVQADVREPADCERMVARTLEAYGRLDILVNNAGANFLSPALMIRPNGWKTILDIVLAGTFFASQAAARTMIDGGGGCIVMNAGANGVSGSPLMAHSGAGKAGMLNLAKSLAVEWAPFGIRVNAVAPGAVETSGANERLWPTPEIRERYARHIPLGRFATPDDVVGAFLFLCSDAARYVTGATLLVDGGSVLRTLPET
jgi:NAD(P)-dependent dehydrogenase (short-subunit alcohol dehydrogenase family)